MKTIDDYLEPSLALGEGGYLFRAADDAELLWSVSSALMPYGTLNILLSNFESNLLLRGNLLYCEIIKRTSSFLFRFKGTVMQII